MAKPAMLFASYVFVGDIDVPGYIWFFLLVPTALVTILAALRRTFVWMQVLSFSLSTVGVAVAQSFYDVFVAKNFDPKFRGAPTVDLELSLFGDAVFALLGLLIFGGTIGCYTVAFSTKVRPGAVGICLPTLFGCLYMTLPWLLYLRHVRPPTYLFWSWAVLAPVASALVTRLFSWRYRKRC